MIHVVQRLDVDTEGVRHALHVEAEALQQLDEVHLLAGKWIVEFRTTVIALRPGASLDETILAPLRAFPLIRRDDRSLGARAVHHRRVVVPVVLAALLPA